MEDSLLGVGPSHRTHHRSPPSSSEIKPLSCATSSRASTSQTRTFAGHSHKPSLHRTHTLPAIHSEATTSVALRDDVPPSSSNSIIKIAFAAFLLYLCLGVLVYSLYPEGFSGIETHPAVDALYFCIVTLCTIGYGDIAPLTVGAKLFSCFFVLIGFGFIEVLLFSALDYVLDIQEASIIASARAGVGAINYIFDMEKGRMRIRMKVGLAISVVIACIGVGTLVLHLVEGLSLMDSLYLSVMSVTTVGYGDQAFKTMTGRVFASLWLLVSTFAVARAFIFLAEARINKRQRRLFKLVLQRGLTVEDLRAADRSRHDSISKSEFVIYKLKQMGKIREIDVMQISNQFNKLDANNTGKITIHDVSSSYR